MEELFVSYELAKKLEEKGFDESCLARYHRIQPIELRLSVGRSDFKSEPRKSKFNSIFIERLDGGKQYPFYSAPLYQQVIDWFDSKHNFNIWVDCSSKRQWIWTINFIDKGDYIQSDDADNTDNRNWWETKKEALDKAIEKALTLI